MKKICAALLLIAFIPLLVFCQRPSGFTIKGAIKGLDTGTVELVYRNLSGDDSTITASIKAGKFIIRGQVLEPELAKFDIRTAWQYSISFFLENSEISFSLIKGAADKTEISGSPSNINYRALVPQLLSFFSNAHSCDNAHQQAMNQHNDKAAKSADSLWAAQVLQWTNTIRASIAEQPKNYAALYFIQWLLFHPLNYDTIMSLYMSLDADVRNGTSGKAFMEQFQHYLHISIGQPAPEISGNDSSGKPERLASLKGQLVLLDFWASYCGICRQENPHLKAVYEKYHDAGFEILAVSLDYERAPWVKAIQHDALSWPQVSELRGGAAASAALYDVQDLPRNWLIDRKGNIIARDLSVADLDKKLAEVLNKGEK